jgi:AcrR family transcriptional regulator
MPAAALSRPRLLIAEDLPPPPRQARSLAARAQLKTAALAIFSEKGYERASIEEISQRAHLAVGGFYLHFRSKRQLLLVLMDDLLEGLSQLDLQPSSITEPRAAIHAILARAFSRDLHYLGAYRAWQEAVLSDAGLAQIQTAIHAWTTARITKLFQLFHRIPGARPNADIPNLARAMDTFFWSLLTQALSLPKRRLRQQLSAATHLIYHALFSDRP